MGPHGVILYHVEADYLDLGWQLRRLESSRSRQRQWQVIEGVVVKRLAEEVHVDNLIAIDTGLQIQSLNHVLSLTKSLTIFLRTA